MSITETTLPSPETFLFWSLRLACLLIVVNLDIFLSIQTAETLISIRGTILVRIEFEATVCPFVHRLRQPPVRDFGQQEHMIRSPVEPDFFVFALPSRGNCSNLRGSLLRSSFRATVAAPTPAETVPGQGLKQPGSWLGHCLGRPHPIAFWASKIHCPSYHDKL